jgi:hypothetical protein
MPAGVFKRKERRLKVDHQISYDKQQLGSIEKKCFFTGGHTGAQ